MVIESYQRGWASVRSAARFRNVWLPVVLLAAVKAAVLFAVYYFWHPSLHGFMGPALQSLFGESAVHYPGHILLLDRMYAAADLALTAALGFPLIAWPLLRISDALRGERASRPFAARLLRLAPSFVLAWALYAGAWKGVPLAAQALAANLSSPRIATLLGLAAFAGGLVLRGMLLYAPVYLALGSSRLLSALAASRRDAATWAWLTAMMVVTAWLFEAPFGYAASWLRGMPDGSGAVLAALLAKCAFEVIAVVYVLVSATKTVVSNREGAAS